jgi:hypothetical protein
MACEILSLMGEPSSFELARASGGDDESGKEVKGYSSRNHTNVTINVPMFGNGQGLKMGNAVNRERCECKMAEEMLQETQ